MKKIRFSYVKENALESFEEGLYKATNTLLTEGVFESFYLKEIVDVIHKHGPYMAITEDTLVLHAQRYEYIKEPFIAYLYSEKSVQFFGKSIHHMFVFGAKDEKNHLNILSTLSHFITELKESNTLNSETRMKQWLSNHLEASS